MSEKIYACLLRLYPPAFRKRYEEETIQLLRDRLRDEPGYFQRLRLGFDLISDILRSLPQAYRNSYANVPSAASIAHSLPAVPMFQSLHNQPIRRGTFVLAGALALTSLIAFGYVMELPGPSPVPQPNRSKSPVESVLERLNSQAAPASTGNATSEIPHTEATATASTEKRLASATNSTLPRQTSAASGTAGQILEPAKPIPNAIPVDPAPSGFAATPLSRTAARRTLSSGQTGTLPGGAPTVMSSQSRVLIAPPAGLSGRWIEYPIADGDPRFPGGFILIQDDTVLRGFGGLNSSHQYPNIHGSVVGNSVKFELSDGRKSFRYDLMLEGEELRGTLIISSGNETQQTSVRLRKAQ